MKYYYTFKWLDDNFHDNNEALNKTELLSIIEDFKERKHEIKMLVIDDCNCFFISKSLQRKIESILGYKINE